MSSLGSARVPPFFVCSDQRVILSSRRTAVSGITGGEGEKTGGQVKEGGRRKEEEREAN